MPARIPVTFLALSYSLLAQASPAPPRVDCAQVFAEALAPDTLPNGDNRLHVTITNACGKDITAFGLRARTGGPGQEMDVYTGGVVDVLPRMIHSSPGFDILRAGATFDDGEIRLSESLLGSLKDSVYVGAVIFADRTAKGDEQWIAERLAGRRSDLTRWHEQYDFLTKLTDHAAAARVLDAGKDPGTGTNLPWRECQSVFVRSDAEAWAKFIAMKKQYELELIELYELHSTLQ